MVSKKGTSKYAKVSNAAAMKGNSYFRGNPARYLVRIDRTVEDESQDARKGEYIAIEGTTLKVFEGSRPSVDYDKGRVEVPLPSVGDKQAEILKPSNQMFEPRLKAAVMTLMGATEEDFAKFDDSGNIIPGEREEEPGQLIEEFLGEEQPAVGLVAEVYVETGVKLPARSKPEDRLSNNDVYPRVQWVRLVPFRELANHLDEKTIRRFFPDIDDLIAAEAELEAESEA